MQHIEQLLSALPEHDLTFLGSAPYVYHCHHFNLFHDQTVEDALGEDEAFSVRAQAAHDASRQLLSELVKSAGAETPAERLELAAATLPWMGHGKLELMTDAGGGRARGSYLHYGFTWREKYGSRVRRRHPADAFAAGYAAAATEVAFSLAPGSLRATEPACFACREPACEIEITEGGGHSDASLVDKEAFTQHVAAPAEGVEEAAVAKIAAGLKDFLRGLDGDERGLLQGFGVYVTRHLANYYDQTAYDTIHRVEKERPQVAGVVESLFGESGHVCVFYTFGGILASPEWEALVGPLRGEPEEIVVGCTAIARGLGFGHWTIGELVPGERLVMRSTSNYEAPFYRNRYGRSEKPRCYFFSNAARAFMQLAHKVDWSKRPRLDDALYQSLFKSDLAWDIEMTRCQTRGDALTEVVVTRHGS